GAAAEQRTAKVGRAAAGAPDDALRWAFERRAAVREHARLTEDLARARVDRRVELVARRPVERAAAIGADLGGDAEPAQEREGAARRVAAGEVEMHGELAAAAQVPDAGGVEKRRELRETAAATAGRD